MDRVLQWISSDGCYCWSGTAQKQEGGVSYGGLRRAFLKDYVDSLDLAEAGRESFQFISVLGKMKES